MEHRTVVPALEEIRSERRLALARGDKERADILAGAERRVLAELALEQRRPTVGPLN